MLVGRCLRPGRCRAAPRKVDTSIVSVAEHDVHQAEAAADDARAPEYAAHLLRRGIGGHVEVLGLEAEQQVAHRAADHVGGVAFFLQA